MSKKRIGPTAPTTFTPPPHRARTVVHKSLTVEGQNCTLYAQIVVAPLVGESEYNPADFLIEVQTQERCLWSVKCTAGNLEEALVRTENKGRVIMEQLARKIDANYDLLLKLGYR